MARFDTPCGIRVDHAGDIVLTDYGNNSLRKVFKFGALVTTLAGNGEQGFTDGQGDAARFNGPTGVALAGTGGYAVVDTGNHDGNKRGRCADPRWPRRERRGSGHASTAQRALGCHRMATWWWRSC